MDSNHVLDIAAGWAVGRGAVVAGALRKQSDWKKAWNARFFVLTSEGLCWFPPERANQLFCANWFFADAVGGDERRHFALMSHVTVHLVGDALKVLSGKSSVSLQAASSAELLAWQAALEQIVVTLRMDLRLAHAFVHQRAALFASSCTESPHIGSRNLREHAVCKTFFVCARAARPRRGLSKVLGGGSERRHCCCP